MIDWQLAVDDVVVDPHREEFGDLSDLAMSIRQTGIVRPLLVTPSGVLVSGSRRLAAAKALKFTHVPVMSAEDLQQVSEAMAADLREDEGQLPMPARAQASLAAALENLPRTPGTSSRKLIAEALGLSEHSWERLRTVSEAVEEGELDDSVFERIDADESPTPAWKDLMEKRNGPLPETPKTWDVTSPHNRTVAEKAKGRLSKAMGGLDGYSDGIGGVELHKVLAVATPEEIQTWRRILGRSINTLKVLRNDLQREADQ